VTDLRSLTIRPAAIGDFDSVLSLVIAQNMAGYGEPMASADTLRELWQSPDLDLAGARAAYERALGIWQHF